MSICRRLRLVAIAASCVLVSLSGAQKAQAQTAKHIVAEATISGQNAICVGQSTTLTASPAATYLWSTGATTGSITVTPTLSTDYWVETDDGLGNLSRDTIHIVVSPLPLPVISGPTHLCRGDVAVLTASGGSQYLWSNGDMVSSILVQPSVTTTYNVTVTNENGCSATISHTVVVHNTDACDILASNDTLCAGSSLSLSAVGGVAYQWANGLGTSSTITVSPAATTTYSVKITTADGCDTTITKQIVVSTLPQPSIAGNLNICQGESTTLSTSEAAAYRWSTASNPLLATTPSVTVSPTTSTDYTLTTFNATGCSATRTVRVTVHTPPLDADIVGPNSICYGEQATLTAAGSGSTYLWSTGETSPSITVRPESTTTYTLVLSNLSGCQSIASKTITVHPMPNISIAGDTLICSGETTTLTATGGVNYLWSTGETSSSIQVQPTATTEYWVKGTNGNGCSEVTHKLVLVTEMPVPVIGGASSICAGETVTLVATGGTSYRWETGETTQSITVSPVTTKTYRVWATNAAGCESALPAEHTITVNVAPTASIMAPTEICQGETAMLTAQGGVTYLWNTGETTQSIMVQPNATTTYSVIVDNGCTATATYTLTVHTPPTLSITGNTAICAGESTTLTANGGTSYIWSDGVTATTASVTVSPTTTTNYKVTAINEYGCRTEKTVTVTVNPLPVPVISGNLDICAGNSTTLTVSGTAGCTYNWNTGETTQSIIVSPLSNTIYTVSVTTPGGCTASTQATVNVNVAPTASIMAPTDICQGETATLTAQGGITYLWNTGETTQSIIVQPNATTTYSVIVDNGCTATATHTITVHTPPTLSITGNTTICEGESTTLTANGGASYVWSDGISATTASVTVSPSTTTIYKVTATNEYGCRTEQTITVTVNPLPVPVISGNLDICAGNSTTLTISGTAGCTYNWSTGATTQSITVSPLSNTIYTAAVTTPSGCTASTQATVNVKPIPTASIMAPTDICQGETATLTAQGGITYLWNTGETTQSIMVHPNSTTTYSVIVDNGCTATATHTITVHTPPTINIIGNASICIGESTTLTATGGTNYVWSNGISATSASVTVSPTTTTIYKVTATNEYGCQAEKTITVTVNPLPVPVISGNLDICAGTGTRLTVSGTAGCTYNWSTGATTQSITVTPQLNTVYTVTVTTPSGCSASAQATVNVSQPIAVSITGINTICVGDNTMLTAIMADGSEAANYVWSDGQIGKTITVSPSVTTTYSVTAYTGAGCTSTAQYKVFVQNLPTVSIIGHSTVCAGTTTQLTAMGAATYLWSTGETTATINVSPSATTTYTVVGTNANGCSATATLRLVVVPKPTATLIAPAGTCINETVTLMATGGTGYLWNTGATTSSIDVTPSTTTSYSVAVFNANGCDTVLSCTIDVWPSPTPVISGNGVICLGESTVLTASGGISYLWSTGETTPSITVQPTVSETYTVDVTDLNGCHGEATRSVIVNALPVATITGDDTICEGESVILTAAGAGNSGSYLWNTGETTPSITVSPLSTTTYSVVAINRYGCVSTSTTHTVNVSSLPTVHIAGNTLICIGSTTMLTATGTGIRYEWSTGETSPSITVATDGTYTVTTYNAQGCSAQASITVTRISLDATVTASEEYICAGEVVTLTAAGGSSYHWNTNAHTASINVSPIGTTTYTVVVSNEAGCTTTLPITIHVNELQVLGSADICLGETATLTATSPAAVLSDILWNTGETTASIQVSPTETTNYSVTAYSSRGCDVQGIFTVNVHTKPTGLSMICPHITCSNEPVMLMIVGSESNSAYLWSTGDRTSSITVNPQTSQKYWCQVSNPYGCDTVLIDSISVLPAPHATIVGVSEICPGESVLLTAMGGDRYYWDINNLTDDHVVVRPTVTTTYSVAVESNNGCVDTAYHTIQVHVPPTVTIRGATSGCIGDSIELQASDSTTTTTYQWSTGETTATIWVKPVANTTYSVRATTQYGCTTDTYHAIAMYPKPLPALQGNPVVCKGTPTTLTATGGVSYLWSTGETTPYITVEPSSATTYWVDVTGAGGCTERMQIPVTVELPPQASIRVAGEGGASSYTTICQGETITLEGFGAGTNGSYVWTDVLNTFVTAQQSITVSPTTTTTYHLTATNEAGCSDVRTFVLNVLPTDSIIIASTRTSVCLGDSITLRVANVANTLINSGLYTWEMPDGSYQRRDAITFMPQQTATYTVFTTNANGCRSENKITIRVYPTFTASIDGQSIVCPGDEVTLTASTADQYYWSTGDTTQTIVVHPMQTTTYTVDVLNAAGCVANASYTQPVYTRQPVIITGDLDIYEGEQTTLTATGALYYYWSTGQNTDQITVQPTGTTTYTLTAVDSNGCSTVRNVQVQVNRYAPPIFGNDTLCTSSETQLSVDGGEGATYLWSTGETTQSIIVSPKATTTYTVRTITAAGAIGYSTKTVYTLPVTEVKINSIPSVCNNEDTLYVAYSVLSGMPSRYTVHFDLAAQQAGFPAEQSFDIDNAYYISIPMPTRVAAGNYAAYITFDNINDCQSEHYDLDILLRKSNMLVLKWNDVLICDNILHEYVDYQWYKDGLIVSGETKQYYSETGGFNGDYYVVVTRTDGSQVTSCVETFHTQAALPMKASPNPVPRYGTLQVYVPFSAAQLTNASLKIYNMAGELLQTVDNVQPTTNISVGMLPGVYVIRLLTANGETCQAKFIVHN